MIRSCPLPESTPFSLNVIFSNYTGRILITDGSKPANVIYLEGVDTITDKAISQSAGRYLKEKGLVQNIGGTKLSTNICSLQTFYDNHHNHAYSISIIDSDNAGSDEIVKKCIIISTAALYGCRVSAHMATHPQRNSTATTRQSY